MSINVLNIKVADPREFEGDPYEVAERAVAQLSGLADVLRTHLDTVEMLVLNAYMERQNDTKNPIDAAAWYDTAEYRNWQNVIAAADTLEHKLQAAQGAAAYNPKRRNV